MLYVPIRSSAAPYLSAAIYQLTRPPHLRDPKDVSTYYCAWYLHPTRPEVATLEIPESEQIPLHTAADGDALSDLLSVFVPTGELSQAEVDALVGAVTQLAGQRVQVAALIPASWQAFVMTREEAIAGGWIAQPSIPGPIN